MGGEENQPAMTAPADPPSERETLTPEGDRVEDESARNETKHSNGEEATESDEKHELESQKIEDEKELNAQTNSEAKEDNANEQTESRREEIIDSTEQEPFVSKTETSQHNLTEHVASTTEDGQIKIPEDNDASELTDHKSGEKRTAHWQKGIEGHDGEEGSEGEGGKYEISGTDIGSGESLIYRQGYAIEESVPIPSMLQPIPEPDFSDLADKEKLFPRPKLSDPRVAYELSCKQLKVVPISQYLNSIENYSENLRLQKYGLAQLNILPLCLSLSYNTTITDLNLSQNQLESDALPTITSMMHDNSYIGHINLSHNNLAGPGLDSLQELFANNYTLTNLDLSHCRLLDAHAPALAAVIDVSLNLRHLNLAFNGLCECGKVLGTVLAVDEGLETLNLSWNTFRSKSARDLLGGLRNNTGLRRLDLSWNSLGPETAVGLRELLRRNTTLAELDVSHNRLVDASVRTVGVGLTKNATLEKIWIGYNPVSPVGALALMRLLPKVSVHYVDMSQIEVSSDFIKLMEKLDPEAIAVVHGTINRDMVLIAPPEKKGFGRSSAKKKK